MSDKALRHVIATIGTIAMLLAYFSGYVSGLRGWWWTIVVFIAVYAVLHKLTDV